MWEDELKIVWDFEKGKGSARISSTEQGRTIKNKENGNLKIKWSLREGYNFGGKARSTTG